MDLRDRYGLTQIVLDPKASPTLSAHLVESLRGESVITVEGVVQKRPQGMHNEKLPTGGVEVHIHQLGVLSVAQTPPFPIQESPESSEASEALRLKYRYLELRRVELQRNLIVRHQMQQAARRYLSDQGFLEVNTPILYKSTPEGARDFLVPSRLQPGHFFALPQSPQILKQLLMIGGLDRYFQIAPCFRDEDLRADRQPEFYQIDIEASFLSMQEFLPLIEGLVAHLWWELKAVQLPLPFPRMTYVEALGRFGSDKPDLRFGLELQDLTAVLGHTEVPLCAGRQVVGLRIPEDLAAPLSRTRIDALQVHLKSLGSVGVLWFRAKSGGLSSPVAKHLTPLQQSSLAQALKLQEGDLALVVSDLHLRRAQTLAGHLRLQVAKELGIDQSDSMHFLWVIDFPLLEFSEQERRYYACHHPFTSPHPDDRDQFVAGRNLANVRAAAYDLVLNGVELGGGSLRNFDAQIQATVFKHLGLSPEETKRQFGFFLEALSYGTPPHGGIAFGVERLAAFLAGVGPIRDVMAFPKTQSGQDLMAAAPSAVDPEQLRALGLILESSLLTGI